MYTHISHLKSGKWKRCRFRLLAKGRKGDELIERLGVPKLEKLGHATINSGFQVEYSGTKVIDIEVVFDPPGVGVVEIEGIGEGLLKPG